MADRLTERWRRFWLWRGGYDTFGRLASWLGSLGAGSHRQLHRLVWYAPPRGFIAPSARIAGVDLRMGSHVFIGERVVIAQWDEHGPRREAERAVRNNGVVELKDWVQINRETTMELSAGGTLSLGEQVGIQMRCYFEAAVHPISIGRRAMIAPYCVFLSGERKTGGTDETSGSRWESKGHIVVGEDAWLGVGVKVLSGVTIGPGAVIAAGAVVSGDIPAGAVAVGNPARVIRHRAALTVEGVPCTNEQVPGSK